MLTMRTTRNPNADYPFSHWCDVTTRTVLWSIALVLGMPIAARAQAVSGWTQEPASGTLPAPIRRPAAQGVKHAIPHPHAIPGDVHTRALVGNRMIPSRGNPQLQPHQLLLAPNHPTSEHRQHVKRGKGLPLLHHKHHRPIQPPAPLLPESNSRPIWKAPYSYGHFGASGTRHWSVHYGYRDRMTEWRLR